MVHLVGWCRRQESNLQAGKQTWVTARRTHHLSNDGNSVEWDELNAR